MDLGRTCTIVVPSAIVLTLGQYSCSYCNCELSIKSTDHQALLHVFVLEHLKWTCLEERRRQSRLRMNCKINSGLADINPASFFRPSDPRPRGAQRLHQEHFFYIFFLLSSHSFFLPLYCLRMKPPPHGYFFSPFTRSLVSRFGLAAKR